MPPKPSPIALALAAIIAASNASSAAILVFDNFDANTPNTNDLNVDIARQTGTLAPVTYTMAFGPGHYGHQLQNGNALNQLLVADFPNSTSSLNTNFNLDLSQGGLRISFDVDSMPAVYNEPNDDHWGALNLGMSQAQQLTNVNGAEPHFGVLFRRNGNIQAFDGAADVTGGLVPYSALTGAVVRHVEVRLSDHDGNPFDGVGDTTIDVFGDINNFAEPVYTFTKIGGYTDNYLNLQGSFRAHIDNFTVEQVPEPGSIGLLALAGFGLALRRRR